MSTHDDCAYWGLTWVECSSYHSRLARYAAGRAHWHAEQAVRLANAASRWALASVVFIVFILALCVLAMILR